MYSPENQYRCTIIRGKSQTDMEDLLPLYANMVHKLCPCEEEQFKQSCCKILSKALFSTESFNLLSESNQKTVLNHLTEIAGTLLGLYFPITDTQSGFTYIYESDSCKHLVEHNDYPIFFKNLCLNFQFPNGAKWFKFIEEDINHSIHIKPFCYVIGLLYYAQSQQTKELLTKQEIGYYVLNNLDVLQGKVTFKEVYDRIMYDRHHKVKREKLSGSKDWQHIKEQFNLLELANLVETDATYIWLNKEEKNSISYFIESKNHFIFDASSYDISSLEGRKKYTDDWKAAYGAFDYNLEETKPSFTGSIVVVGKDEQYAHSGATKSSVDLGDEGEALVFRLEQERIKRYKERLVNKVLLLGKTKGLGYDISSIEGDENPLRPEFARYIEVKSTKRVTEPSFNNTSWTDSLNITAKEWVAAEQYGEYYNIYRVYFTKTKTFIVRINNPYKKSVDGEIEVYPTIYQMTFDRNVIEIRYAE